MAVNTKNVKTDTGGFVPKNLQPGNNICTIHSITMEKASYVKERDEYEIKLVLEGPPLPNFEGFNIDNNDPSKGKFKGQCAIVKLSQWNYKDGETTNGYKVVRDDDIVRDLTSLCKELGILDWIESKDGIATVEQLVQAMNTEKPFAGISMHYCLAGREYLNKKNYKAYDLHLPRVDRSGKPFSKDDQKVQKFFESAHIKAYVPKTMASGFGGSESTSTSNIEDATVISETTESPFRDEFQAEINAPVENKNDIISNNQTDLEFSL